jgi:hypothetical protein
MPRRSLVSSADFLDRVVPELLRRYDERCYCCNPSFLKLVSFDFRSYGIAPVSLVDAEHVIWALALRRFEPVSGWSATRERVDSCPQCGTRFRTRAEEYSINMQCAVMTPLEPLAAAQTGLYVSGYHYYTHAEQDLARITDFEPALSVESFVSAITRG